MPSYIAEPEGGRFWLEGRSSFGTESSQYALGGTKFWRGDDPAHPGGDVWVVDAALAIMEREDWGAMVLALGGVDRVGHMMGADHDLQEPNPSPVRFREALLEADRQIGRLLDGLRAKGLDDETLVVISADHGGMFVENLHATERPGKAGYEWNWGRMQNLERLDPQPEIARLIAGGGVEATSTDTAIRVWAIPGDPAAKTLPERVQKLPGVISVWVREGSVYRETWRDFSKLPEKERAFQRRFLESLVASCESEGSADVMALLDEKTGYAVRGDHGGAQENVQRIPVIFSGPNVKPGRHVATARSVDIAPTVWALAGKTPPPGLDGQPLCAAVASSAACPR